MRRNFSLVARHWLESAHCSLLVAEVAKSARYSLQKLLVAKKSLIPRCKVGSLLAAKNHSLLVANNHSTLVNTTTS